MIRDQPSPFVARWLARHAAGAGDRALDCAMGRGRHALLLAAAGYETVGIDLSLADLREARTAARAKGLTLRLVCADLTQVPLPAAVFDVVVVTRYLQRDLCASLAGTLRPGGVLLYETFTVAQRQLPGGPRSSAHLLEHGELPALFSGLETLFYEEQVGEQALARLAARRPRAG